MSNLFFFTGENTPELYEKLRFWKKEFIKKHTESNLEIFEEAKDADLVRVINAIETTPFLAEKRLIIIKGLPESTDSKSKLDTSPLEDALLSLLETSLVVLVNPRPDKRTRLYKFLVKYARLESFEIPKGVALNHWVMKRVQQQGKQIDAAAIDLLLFFTAANLVRLSVEIEKLGLLDQQGISLKDIERLVSPTPEAKIFKTLDQIGKTDYRMVLQEFEKLSQGEGDMMMVFYMIVRQFRLLLQTRYLLDQHSSGATIQKRLRLAPFQVGMLSSQAKYFTLDQLKTAFSQLLTIDYQLKTGRIPSSSGQEELLRLKIDQFLCSVAE